MGSTEVDKTMFEIYREAEYRDRYRVVYFTELDEHSKEREIGRAMAGENVFDGYLRDRGKGEAKRMIEGVLDRLNGGEKVAREEVRALLAPWLVD
jgi:hypothetical protein